jgi:hypothetical protein
MYSLITIGEICSTVIAYGDTETFYRFFTVCHDEMISEIEGGAASEAYSASSIDNPFGMSKMSDARFHWFQSIFSHICALNGPCVQAFNQEIVELILRVNRNCISRRAYKWNAKALRSSLESLTTVYLTENRPLTFEEWNQAGTAIDSLVIRLRLRFRFSFGSLFRLEQGFLCVC